jgi:D-alanyl-D-alanine carboxypeptidase
MVPAAALVAFALLAASRPALADETPLEPALEVLVQQAVSAPGAPPAALLRVQAPRLGLDWAGEAVVPGRDEPPPRADGTLRIASNTKSYVAAAALRLAEDGRLGLDAPVERLLLPATVATLRAGSYRPEAITVRMLLTHTAGLYDYANDQAFIERVLAEPRRRWSRAEQVEWATTHGKPQGAPGEAFHYSDTAYILLGEILETTTGEPMAAAVRALVGFERLGLIATWFETLEPEPPDAPPRLRQRIDGMDVAAFDASSDLYGGGGLVSTLPELARFYRALLQGEVFERPGTLATLLTPSAPSLASGEGGYGMGLGRLQLANGVDCFGHSGFWGTEAWHCPAVDVTVVGAVTEANADEALGKMTRGAVERVVAEIGAAE